MMGLREIAALRVDLLMADDGTTVLIRAEDEDGSAVEPGFSGVVVFRLWCGGDDAHCDADGWCVHTRALADAQDEMDRRRIELVERPNAGAPGSVTPRGVLMSATQAKRVAAAIRRTEGPGLLRVGVAQGRLYVEFKADHGTWAMMMRDDAPRLVDEPEVAP